MEYFYFYGIELYDKNPENVPDVSDCIELKGNHDNLLISYYDVERVIKALRQGKRKIDRYYQKKANKGGASNE